MKKYTSCVVWLFCLICAGFGQKPQAKVESTPLPEYDMSVRLLPDEHRLEASGTIRLPAFDSLRSEIQMYLSYRMRDLSVEILEPKTSAGAAKVEKRKDLWTIIPPQPIPAGERVLMRFSYTGGENIGVVFYLGPEGSFAGGLNTTWYPQPNKGKGTGTIKFSVPAGYSVMATGVQKQTPEEAAQGSFRFEVEKPTYFGFAAARYTIVRQTSGAVPVSAYLLRPRENIKEYIDGCSRVLSLLVKEFGDYPYSEFALVEVPTEQANNAGFSGASVDGFILADSLSLDAPYNLAYYGHEIGHQWWGNIIRTKDTRGSYMLGEGMAQYGALRVVETIEGAEAAEKFRRTGYPGYNLDQSGFGYLRHAAAGFDNPLADLPANSLSHQIANSKGFLIFNMLARIVGREKFSRAVREFTKRNAFRLITWDEFLQAIEKDTGRNLKWFFAQWFERESAPDFKLTWKQEGKNLRGIITQSPPLYQTEAEVQIDGDDGQRTMRKIEIRSEGKTEFALNTNFSARTLTLDPHFQILRWTPEYKAEANVLAEYTKANRRRNEGKLEEAQSMFKSALENVPQPDFYGAEFMLRYGLARVFISQKKWSEAKAQLELAVSNPTRPAEILPRVYLQLARAYKETGDTAALKRAIDAAATADAVVGGRSGVTREARALLNR